jgi:hypothetical protein
MRGTGNPIAFRVGADGRLPSKEHSSKGLGKAHGAGAGREPPSSPSMGVRWVLNRGSRVRVQQAVSRPESLQRGVTRAPADRRRTRTSAAPSPRFASAAGDRFPRSQHRDQRRKDHQASPYESPGGRRPGARQGRESAALRCWWRLSCTMPGGHGQDSRVDRSRRRSAREVAGGGR